ncbi:Nucleolar protein 10, partial [Globisporangium splendens]
MAALAATSLNGVKIYNLASGKTLPQWIAEKTKKALSKDEGASVANALERGIKHYRRRIELLQDFHFASGSQRVKMSGDGNFIVATGMYPPTVKVFDVRDLSMKFERRLDAEVVQLEILSQDFGKLCFLQTDRNLTFHAPYGTHYSLRIPKFGRDMCYHRENCDIYVAASGTDVYRVNLDQGRFLAPLELSAPAANVVKLNPIHQMLGVGCEDGTVECWDTRSQRRVGVLDGIATYAGGVSASSFDEAPVQVTALEFDDDGLTFGVGTSNGHCMLYDLRSSKPLLQKSHQYGLPIIDLKFHDYSKKVVSSDAKVIKIWDKRDGEIFTNVETPSEVRDVCLVEGSQGKSGVLLVAGEQERVMSYYLPELGIAPKWCSFLDSLTEELEEEAQSTVYDDYKFVTRKELLSFGLEHMIGTPLLKAYMHGFFMDARLHAKVKAIAEPFAYDKWRKEKLQAKLEAKQSNRITIQRRLPKVNRAVAERLLSSKDKNKNKKNGSDDEEEDHEDDYTAGDAFANPLGDDRFSRMFTSKDFEVDEDHETYKLLHPNAAKKQKKEDMDSDAGTDDDDDDEDDAVGGRFDLVSDDDEVEGRPSDESSSEDEEEGDSKQRQRLGGAKSNAQPAASANRKPKFYEIAKGEKVGDLMDFGSTKDRAAQKEKKQLAKLPLSERVKLERVREKERSAFKKEEKAGGGYMREMSFIPQSDLRKQERQREREAARDGDATNERRKKRGVGDLKLANPGRNPRFRR